MTLCRPDTTDSDCSLRSSCKLAESVADSMAKKLNTLAQRLHAVRLAQLGEHRYAEREVAGSDPGWTNNQGLKKHW